MNTTARTLAVSSLISLIMVFPFLLLEILNRRHFSESFPYSLFTILWIVMLAFIFVLIPIVRNLQTGTPSLSTTNLITRFTILLLLSFFWIRVIIDQMPCFLGVVNCD